jgi:uncharacterized membrane protein YphA (DoxX/SURF4 family)
MRQRLKLPLMYALMLIPLVLSGPGRLSIDHAIRGWLARRAARA